MSPASASGYRRPVRFNQSMIVSQPVSRADVARQLTKLSIWFEEYGDEEVYDEYMPSLLKIDRYLVSLEEQAGGGAPSL